MLFSHALGLSLTILWTTCVGYYIGKAWKRRNKFPIKERYYVLSTLAVVGNTVLCDASILNISRFTANYLPCRPMFDIATLVLLPQSVVTIGRLMCMLYDFEKEKIISQSDVQSINNVFMKHPLFGRPIFWEICHAIVLSVVMLYELLYLIIESDYALTCLPNKQFEDDVELFAATLTLILIVITGYLTWKLSRHAKEDSLGLKREMRTYVIVCANAIIVFCTGVWGQQYSAWIFLSALIIDAIMSFIVQLWIPLRTCDAMDKLRTDNVIIVSPSDAKSKRTLPYQSVCDLETLLNSEEGFEALKEFASLECNSELLIFWKRVEDYRLLIRECAARSQFDTITDAADKKHIGTKIRDIAAVHVRAGSLLEVNVSAEMRNKTYQDACFACLAMGVEWSALQSEHKIVQTAKSMRYLSNTLTADDVVLSVRPISIGDLAVVYDNIQTEVIKLMKEGVFFRFREFVKSLKS